MHPKGANSMAMSGLGFRKALILVLGEPCLSSHAQSGLENRHVFVNPATLALQMKLAISCHRRKLKLSTKIYNDTVG